MSKTIAFTLALAAAILLADYTRSLRAQLPYADTPCPVCGSRDVLSLEETGSGERLRCFDCKTEFYSTQTDNENENH